MHCECIVNIMMRIRRYKKLKYIDVLKRHTSMTNNEPDVDPELGVTGVTGVTGVNVNAPNVNAETPRAFWYRLLRTIAYGVSSTLLVFAVIATATWATNLDTHAPFGLTDVLAIMAYDIIFKTLGIATWILREIIKHDLTNTNRLLCHSYTKQDLIAISSLLTTLIAGSLACSAMNVIMLWR
jgi:hypothetical protein